MALLTRGVLVSSRQRECGCRVIKLRTVPRSGRVTRLAGRRESCRRMIRILRVVEVSLVTAYAVRGSSLVLPVQVALGAGERHVCSGQGKSSGRVIEVRTEPSGSRVTGLASGWEPGRDVVRILGVVEVRLMTADAVGRCSLVLSVNVTLRTGYRLVRTR